jgi:hypothetical protein
MQVGSEEISKHADNAMSEDENKEMRYQLRARCLDIWLKITEQQPSATFHLVDG